LIILHRGALLDLRKVNLTLFKIDDIGWYKFKKTNGKVVQRYLKVWLKKGSKGTIPTDNSTNSLANGGKQKGTNGSCVPNFVLLIGSLRMSFLSIYLHLFITETLSLV